MHRWPQQIKHHLWRTREVLSTHRTGLNQKEVLTAKWELQPNAQHSGESPPSSFQLLPPLPRLYVQIRDKSSRYRRIKRSPVLTLPFLLLHRNTMLSCCLLGAHSRRDKAIQLLTVPCLNQPFIELAFHQHLELLPLIPATKRRWSARKHAKVILFFVVLFF